MGKNIQAPKYTLLGQCEGFWTILCEKNVVTSTWFFTGSNSNLCMYAKHIMKTAWYDFFHEGKILEISPITHIYTIMWHKCGYSLNWMIKHKKPNTASDYSIYSDTSPNELIGVTLTGTATWYA